MKSRFFANISHEFRTPLTLILGPLEKMISKTRDKNDRQDLTMMQRNAMHLAKIINELLDLAKLEHHQIKLAAARGDIVRFLKTLTASFKSAAAIKDLALSFYSENQSIIAHYDPDKVQKIFNNLLSNALKFTPEGGSIQVRVSVMNDDKRGRVGEGEMGGAGELVTQDP